MKRPKRGSLAKGGAVVRNQARIALRKAGIPLPPELALERITHRVKSPIGTLVVREGVGLVRSPAVSIVKQFEKNIEGKVPVEMALSAAQASGARITEGEQRLLEVLLTPRGKKIQLARLIAESGANPVTVMDTYTRGLVHLKRREAIAAAAEEMPQLIKNLIGHAASEVGDVCSLCAGSGTVARSATTGTAPASQVPCPSCDTVGRVREVSELKKFAVDRLLEVNKLVEKGGGITVQTVGQVNMAAPTSGSLLEKVRRSADEVLYRKTEDVVEAEVVS